MADLILGRSFWSTFSRFAFIPILLSLIALPFIIMTEPAVNPQVPQLSFLQQTWIVVFHVVGWSWIGWGLAFWRFDASQRPVRSFALYPMLSGLVFVPVFWILLSISSDPTMSDYIGVTVFGCFAGPLIAYLFAKFFRTAPQLTAMRKSAQ